MYEYIISVLSLIWKATVVYFETILSFNIRKEREREESLHLEKRTLTRSPSFSSSLSFSAPPGTPFLTRSTAKGSIEGSSMLTSSTHLDSSRTTKTQLPRSASSGRPLQSIQAPQTMRDPLAPGGTADKRTSVNSNKQLTSAEPVKEQPPKEEKKKDRSKLTEQWGSPPEQIRRDNEWLQRGQLLGEVRIDTRRSNRSLNTLCELTVGLCDW